MAMKISADKLRKVVRKLLSDSGFVRLEETMVNLYRDCAKGIKDVAEDVIARIERFEAKYPGEAIPVLTVGGITAFVLGKEVVTASGVVIKASLVATSAAAMYGKPALAFLSLVAGQASLLLMAVGAAVAICGAAVAAYGIVKFIRGLWWKWRNAKRRTAPTPGGLAYAA